MAQCYPQQVNPAGQTVADTISQATGFIQAGAAVVGISLLAYLLWPSLTRVRAGSEVRSEVAKARSRTVRQRLRQAPDYQDEMMMMSPSRSMSRVQSQGYW